MESVEALMAGLVDYAGLFPPAELGMREAVENFAEYSSGPDSAWLGRFIVPVERLDELEDAVAALGKKREQGKPWPLSVLVKSDVAGALNRIRKIGSNDSGLRVAALEIQLSSLAEISKDASKDSPAYETFVEVSPTENLDEALPRLKDVGAKAKLRTGGVTPAAFPTTGAVVRFIRGCCNTGVSFKATAGLHHPVRAQYNLTYEKGSAIGTMFGFLNLFLAAAFMWNNADDVTVSRILDETDSSAFTFSDSAITWRERSLSTNRIAAAREEFATSFGSCSFREPVDELKLLLSGAAV
jgi:hypothetical protein